MWCGHSHFIFGLEAAIVANCLSLKIRGVSGISLGDSLFSGAFWWVAFAIAAFI